ncbi:MAG: hypothetical protein K9M80_01250 [Candidatus Marinimicrobia bacterium]|nr:hypothetical protein [Candidatus Neomarinimicrobiota bacterium]
MESILKIGIRREDKNQWEGRTPLIPEDVNKLINTRNIEACVQPSSIRAYSDQEYRKAGAKVQEDLSGCDLILAVKEIPLKFFQPEKTYLFFSHTFKGQCYNIPIIKQMQEFNDNLLDYERIINGEGRRLVFFGRFAGLAGMIDSLWGLKERFKSEGLNTPFQDLKYALNYSSLKTAKQSIKKVGKKIYEKGFPAEISPVTIGIAGYGHVSQGAQEILDLLPNEEIKPKHLQSLIESGQCSNKKVYKVIFREEDMVKPINLKDDFEILDYYQHPQKYKSNFYSYLPFLTVLINAIYWDSRYPRLVTKKQIEKLYITEKPKLKVIGDISCDIEGAIEPTVKIMDSGHPVYVYDVGLRKAINGINGNGPVILAVDNLPCEFARDSSRAFSKALMDLLPELLDCDFQTDFEDLKVDNAIKKSIILYHGKLTPDYDYLNKYV